MGHDPWLPQPIEHHNQLGLCPTLLVPGKSPLHSQKDQSGDHHHEQRRAQQICHPCPTLTLAFHAPLLHHTTAHLHQARRERPSNLQCLLEV